jgi:hypothetical protein
VTVDVGLLLRAAELSLAPILPLGLWFLLLRKVPRDIAALPRSTLVLEYGRLEQTALLPFLVSAAVCIWGWWRTLLALLPRWSPRDPGTVHSIGLEAAYWFLPALFLGLVTAPIPTYLLMAPRLRRRFWGFIREQDQAYGGFTIIGMAIIAAAAVINVPLLYAGWRATTNFLPDRVVIHHVFAPPSARPYASVTALEHVSRLEDTEEDGRRWTHAIRIRFADGTRWSGNAGGEDATRRRELGVLRYVSERSGVPVTDVRE